MDLQDLSANWKTLQAQLKQSPQPTKEPLRSQIRKRDLSSIGPSRNTRTHEGARKRARRNGRMSQSSATSSQLQGCERFKADGQDKTESDASRNTINIGLSSEYSLNHAVSKSITNATSVEIGRYIAVDCEMVGVGPEPDRESALARVSVVNYDGDQVYDAYVKPLEKVTDWRTSISGILPRHMARARTLEEAQADLSAILRDRILIGHSIRNDLDAMLMGHPKRDIRDTAKHPPYRKIAGGSSPRLKILASELLGFDIQTGEHSSVEDARACMLLFRRDRAAFEKEHTKRYPPPRTQTPADESEPTQAKKSKKKNKKRK